MYNPFHSTNSLVQVCLVIVLGALPVLVSAAISITLLTLFGIYGILSLAGLAVFLAALRIIYYMLKGK